MADLEFFLDPVCPWAWITSRWVTEVQQLRSYEVVWRFISLREINAPRSDEAYTPEYRQIHMAGTYAMRVMDQARLHIGNEAVAALYTAVGSAFHPGRRGEIGDDPVGFMAQMLTDAALPADLAGHALDESHDAHLHLDTEAALARTGRDVGTPILTFRPGQPDEGSFFGPVIAKAPRGNDALRLWDAVETIATTTGVCELKRSNRASISYE
ncbi:MAG: hypothetical protein WCI22_09765 [Actinomycetota bacterium]